LAIKCPFNDLVIEASSSSSSSSNERVYQLYRAQSAPGSLLGGLSLSLSGDNSDQSGAPPYPDNTGQEQEQLLEQEESTEDASASCACALYLLPTLLLMTIVQEKSALGPTFADGGDAAKITRPVSQCSRWCCKTILGRPEFQ
jgi:hypothetical protein